MDMTKGPNGEEDGDEQPGLVAWFKSYPVVIYPNETLSVNTAIKNEGEEPVTELVCLEVNGEEEECDTVTLAPSDLDRRAWMHPGQPEPTTLNLEVLNASKQIPGREYPREGEWINGSLADLRLVSVSDNPHQNRHNVTVAVRLHNGSTPAEVQFHVGMTSIQLGPRNATYDNWKKDESVWRTNRSVTATREPDFATGRVGDISDISYDENGNISGYSSTVTDPNLFQWKIIDPYK